MIAAVGFVLEHDNINQQQRIANQPSHLPSPNLTPPCSNREHGCHRTPGPSPPCQILQAQGIIADPWQHELLLSPAPRILLNCCRRAGKSRVTSALALHTALFQPKALVLLISRAQRQAMELDRLLRAGQPGHRPTDRDHQGSRNPARTFTARTRAPRRSEQTLRPRCRPAQREAAGPLRPRLGGVLPPIRPLSRQQPSRRERHGCRCGKGVEATASRRSVTVVNRRPRPSSRRGQPSTAARRHASGLTVEAPNRRPPGAVVYHPCRQSV